MSTITVRIHAKQVIEYNQVVEMEIEDYEKVKHLEMHDVGEWHKADKEAYYVLESYINPLDVFDSEREFTDVTVKTPKK